MRIWKTEIPTPQADADDIVTQTITLLELDEYRNKFVKRNNKIYYVSKFGRFAFYIDPNNRRTRYYDKKDEDAKKIWVDNTEEMK